MTGPTIFATAATRAIEPGTAHYLKVPAISAASLVPTLAELQAGTDFSHEIMDITGFSVTPNNLPAPNWSQRFVPSAEGTITADDSSITIYADPNGSSVDASSLFTEGAKTFIVALYNNFATGGEMDVFQVHCSSISRPHSAANLATKVISFAIDGYNRGQTVPTS